MLRYIARQPILDAEAQTFGYELLYRAAEEDFARISNQNDAARSVVDDLLTLGLEELGRGKRLFLNCTQDLLTQRTVELLPAKNVVLEVLENVVPDFDLLHSCSELKDAGYSLALDDFIPNPEARTLVPYADFIKLDFRAMPFEECGALVREFGEQVKFVAEKIETREEFTAAREMGCSLFQGYFFARPAVMQVRQIPTLYANYVRLLAATCKEAFEFHEIEQIIKSDVALSYKLLRYLNSAAFCLRSQITSLQQALVLLGENAIRRWVCVSATATAAQGKTPELLTTALLRARFCELLALNARCNPYHAFLVGLFSCMDALLEMPLESVLINVELPCEVRDTLYGVPGRLQCLFRMAADYLGGKWEAVRGLGIPEPQIASCYLEAVRFVDALTALSGD